MKAINPQSITLRPISGGDIGFLRQVYAASREDEMTLTGWQPQEIDDFIQMQFDLQHTQWMQNFKDASFDIVLLNDVPIGRLYVGRMENELRIIDIALLIEYRLQGIGGKLMADLIRESDKTQRTLSLHVEMNNPILAFYQKLGFKTLDASGLYYYMERAPSE